MGFAQAGTFDLSQTPMEVPQGTIANAVIILDDSASMEAEVITTGYDNMGMMRYNQPFKVTTPSASELVGTPSGLGIELGSWLSYRAMSSNFIAADTEWRFRNSKFNTLYYDPTKTYEPWPGLSSVVDSAGAFVPYSELTSYLQGTITDKLFGIDDVTRPAILIDLLSTGAKQTQRGSPNLITRDANTYTYYSDGTTDGFSYYTWDDTYPTPIANDEFDNDDTITRFKVNGMTTVSEQNNFQNWFNFHRSRMLVAKGALRNVLENSYNIRIGFAPLNNGNPHYEVKDMDVEIDDTLGDKYKLTKAMDSINMIAATPLRQALNDVGQYFSASSTNNKFGAGKHPYLMSDATTVAPAAACQQNYAILFTDGYWGGSFSGSDWDSDASSAYDNRDFASFADKDKQSSPTLADVAMHYYERDLISNTTGLMLKDNVPITLTDRYPHSPDIPAADELSPFVAGARTMHQNMKTYTIAFGLGDGYGTDKMPKVLDTEFEWLNPFTASENKRQDLLHAAYNGRGEFFSANNYDDLINSLRSSFNSIVLNYRIGSAGVAFNSQELKTGTYIFRAFYNPETYEGDLVAVAFDSEGNPQLNTPVWSAAEQIEDQLCSDPSDPLTCDSSTRLVVTYDPYSKTGELFNHANLNKPSPEVLPGNPNQLGWFEKTPPKNLAGNGVLVDSYGNGDEYWTDERIRYLRGERSQEGKLQDDGGLRRRTGLLGDFANSTPRYVGVPQARRRGYAPYPVDPNYLTSESKNYSTFKITYKDRDELVYVGANDGMLHAFDANSGREAFAYVPNLVMDDLYEYTLPSYLHKMSVDGSPGINDVFIDDGRVNNERWRTMLVGGLRSGGKGYYALDITKPSTFNSTEMAANVLWEFSDINDSRLGYTFSTPNLVMSNATATYTSSSTVSEVVTYNRWIALFGNGYNQSATNGFSGLFTLFLDQGGDTTWDSGDWRFLSTGVDSTGLTFPNGMSTPRAVDIDNNGSVDYVYAGDLAGNLYRFDLTSSDPSLWRVDPILFKGSVTKPITVQPIVMSRGANEGQVIVVSTGSWMTEQDRTSTATQSIYGIWDPLQDSWGTGPSAIATGWGPEITPTNLTAQSFTNVGTKFNGTDITYRTLSANDVVYNHAKNARKMGWKIDLNLEFPGERAIRNLLIKEGVLFGSTIIPQSNQACMNGPGGYLFSIDALTGGSVVGGPSFDLNNDGKFDELDVVEVAGTGTDYQDYAAAIRIEGGLPSDIAVIDGGKNDGSKVCYQTSTGDLVCTTVNVGSSYPEGRLSWKELSY